MKLFDIFHEKAYLCFYLQELFSLAFFSLRLRRLNSPKVPDYLNLTSFIKTARFKIRFTNIRGNEVVPFCLAGSC